MKELSIEEKAKAYDMAIEELRGLLECIHEDKCDIMEEDIIKIFPELKESEDEKIRACIEMCLTDIDEQRFADFNTNLKECRDWLEKQGEYKPAFDIDIPFGAKDSELIEASYYIPEGFHAEIEGNHVVIKKGEQKSAWSEEDKRNLRRTEYAVMKFFGGDCSLVGWLRKSLKERYTWKPSDEQLKAQKGE